MATEKPPCVIITMAPTCEYCSRLIYGTMEAHLITCKSNPAKRPASSSTTLHVSKRNRITNRYDKHSSLLETETGSLVELSFLDDISRLQTSFGTQNSPTVISKNSVMQEDTVACDPNKSSSNAESSLENLLSAMSSQLFASTAWQKAASNSIRNGLYEGMIHNVNFGMNESPIHVIVSKNPTISTVSSTSLPLSQNRTMQDMRNRNIIDISSLAVGTNDRTRDLDVHEQLEDLDEVDDNNVEENEFVLDEDIANDIIPTLHASTQQMLDVVKKHETPHVVLFSPRHIATLELHHMLARVNVPKYLFDKIYKWAFRHKIEKSYSRKSLVKDMKEIIQIPNIEPTRISLVIAEDYSVSLTKFDFLNQFYSLLMDTDLMVPVNLIFGDDPLEVPIWGDDTPLSDVNTSYWHFKTYQFLCSNDPLHMLCPIILFEDETFCDAKGHLKLHCVSFTLGIFNHRTRQRLEAWRHLGFIPKAVARCPPGASIDADVRHLKLVDHHRYLVDILQSLKDAQALPPIDWMFGDTAVKMFIPLMFSIGDIEGQDKLCCRYASHSTGLSSTMRDCNVPTGEAGNPDFLCSFTHMSRIFELGKAAVSTLGTPESIIESKTILKEMSFHYGVPNAFDRIDFGYNPRGINGAVPPCLMHSLRGDFLRT